MRILTCLVVMAAFSGALGLAPNQDRRIACIGTSITAGVSLKDSVNESWPAQMARLLGNRDTVGNFGRNEARMINYCTTMVCKKALAFLPDIAVVELGTNDTQFGFPGDSAFVDSAQSIINALRALPSKPRIHICLPLKVVLSPATTDEWVMSRIVPLLKLLAQRNGLPTIALHDVLPDTSYYTKDTYTGQPVIVHPNVKGAALIARRVADSLTYDPANRPPHAAMAVTQSAGMKVTCDGSSSSDPDGDRLCFSWDLGDSTRAWGVIVSHSYKSSGNRKVLLTVIDYHTATEIGRAHV